MRTFSPSDAAFEGFRVIHRYPGAILAWAVAHILLFVVIGGAAFALFGPQLTELSRYSGSGSAVPPEEALRFAGSFIGLGLLAIPLALLVTAIFVNAVYRPILRPDDKGLFFLKISGDEWRQALLLLAYIGLAILVEIGLVICTIVITAITAGVLHARSGGGGWAALLAVVLGIGVICLAIWVLVRLSLGMPMTFAQKRVRVFGSWGVTRGKFWSLLGAYLLAWIFGLLVGILGWIVSIAAGAAITGDWTGMSGMMNPRAMMLSGQINMLSRLFTVGVIVQLVLSSLFQAVSRTIMYAPAAAAYRALTADDSCPVDEAPPAAGGGLVL